MSSNVYQRYQFAKAGINPDEFVAQEAYLQTDDVTSEMEKLSKEYDEFEVDYISVTNLGFDKPELIDRFLKNNSIIKAMKVSRESLGISTEDEKKEDKRGFLRKIFDFIINTFKTIFGKLLKFLNWIGKQLGIVVEESEEAEEAQKDASVAAKLTAKQIAKRAAELSKKGIKTSAALGAEFAVLTGCAVIGTGMFAKYVGQKSWEKVSKWTSSGEKPKELVKQTEDVDEIKAKAEAIAEGISNMTKEDKSVSKEFEQFKSAILYEPDEVCWPLFAFDRSKEPFTNAQYTRIRELETTMFSNLNVLKNKASPRAVLSVVQKSLDRYKDDIIKDPGVTISDELRRKFVTSVYKDIVDNLKDLKSPQVRGNISNNKYVSYQQGSIDHALGAQDANAQHEKFKKVFTSMFAANPDKFNINESHPYKKITIDTERIYSLRANLNKLSLEFQRANDDVIRSVNEYNHQQVINYTLDNVSAVLDIRVNSAHQVNSSSNITFAQPQAQAQIQPKLDKLIDILKNDVFKIFKNMEELYAIVSKAYISILVDSIKLFNQQNKALTANMTIKVTEK